MLLGEVISRAECPLMDFIIAFVCVMYIIICQSKSYRPMESCVFFNIRNTLGVLFPTGSISLI